MHSPHLITLIRHGQPHAGTLAPAREHPALSVAGREQLTAAARRLSSAYGRYDRCFHSHHRIASMSAEALGLCSTLVEDPRLAEVDIGRPDLFDGGVDIALAMKPIVDTVWRGSPYDVRPKGGESWNEAELRVRSFLETLRHDYVNHKVLVVAHDTWFMLFRRIMERMTVAEILEECRRTEHARLAYRTYARRGDGPLIRFETVDDG